MLDCELGKDRWIDMAAGLWSRATLRSQSFRYRRKLSLLQDPKTGLKQHKYPSSFHSFKATPTCFLFHIVAARESTSCHCRYIRKISTVRLRCPIGSAQHLQTTTVSLSEPDQSAWIQTKRSVTYPKPLSSRSSIPPCNLLSVQT